MRKLAYQLYTRYSESHWAYYQTCEGMVSWAEQELEEAISSGDARRIVEATKRLTIDLRWLGEVRGCLRTKVLKRVGRALQP